ncbi:tubulin-specific chaperone C [Athalia rosae]|uniref:tubulin-specific chaperone C n=1 Tax=Athalia rosae TaxID=37344 RepID=UPI00203451F4|nr:tubulin-specific chaperone C [Athalia rosae]
MDSTSLIEGSLPDRITKRDRERKNVIEKRREERQQLAVESEQASYFKDAFYATCKTIKDLLDNACTASPTVLPSIFDKANKEIQTLKNFLSQSKMFLKVYDIRRAQENLQLLEIEADELELKLLPKKKFGFKNRRVLKKPSEKCHDVTDGLKDLKISDSIVNSTSHQNNKLSSKYGDSALMIMGKTDEKIILDTENVNKNDVLLSDLTGCMIRIYGAPSTLHMVNLRNCTVLVGPVSSSVFAERCNACSLAFACQQLRLHTSINCDVYCHVTSRAIIEDCFKIRFAPYNWCYDDLSIHFQLAGLDQKINNWHLVDDFNWLSNEKHSPNWSILDPELRVKSWD